MEYEKKIDIPFGANDSELKGWAYTIPEGMEAIIKDGKVIVREKESEDERLRKAAIEAIEYLEHNLAWDAIGDTDILDVKEYLEKQKDTNKEYWRGYREGKQEILDKYAEIEKQKEQKPTFYPGDVIKCTSTGSLWVRCKDKDNISSDGHTACIGGGYELASEEETVQFFKELNENGYQWDCIKGRPIKKEPKPGTTEDNPIDPFDTKLFQDGVKEGRRLEREDMQKEPFSCCHENGSSEKPNNQWSEDDEKNLELVTDCVYEFYPDPVMKYWLRDWLKSLRSRPKVSDNWKPSEEQMGALKEASASWMNREMGNCELLESLYNDLKKLYL